MIISKDTLYTYEMIFKNKQENNDVLKPANN